MQLGMPRGLGLVAKASSFYFSKNGPMISDTSRFGGGSCSFSESNAHTRQCKDGLGCPSPLHDAAIHVLTSATQSLKYAPGRLSLHGPISGRPGGPPDEAHRSKFIPWRVSGNWRWPVYKVVWHIAEFRFKVLSILILQADQ